MKIIKRNGSEQEFNPSKIHVAMTKAFRSVEEGKTVSEETIANLTAKAVAKVQEIPHTPNVEEVQDFTMFLAAILSTALPMRYAGTRLTPRFCL